MADLEPNPLLSNSRASDTSPTVQLHPLVLLTISDYITRHVLRKMDGPIVGAILGRQNGREITMEVAFESKLRQGQGGEFLLDESWFQDRLEQFKDVYKSPPLDLLGWFTLGSVNGPRPHHLPIHQHIQELYNESAILLLFHPDTVTEGTATSGKLPLTLYESVLETAGNSDKTMDIDSENPGKQLKFRELTYSVETGEAEMIGVDFVARGGGNATAIDTSSAKKSQTKDPKISKGKTKESEAQVNGAPEGDSPSLSPADEELLASLTAKSNAIKMLRQRLRLIHAYLSSLPPSYLTDPSLPPPTDPNALNHTILRSIAAMLSRLPLLAPADAFAFARESLEQKSDVKLVELLSSITSSVQSAKEMGRKYAVVENSRASQRTKAGLPIPLGEAAGMQQGFMDTVMGPSEGRTLRPRDANIGGGLMRIP